LQGQFPAMKTLSLQYRLPGVDWLFSVPSNDPLKNSGPLISVFQQLLNELRAESLPAALKLTMFLPVTDCTQDTIEAIHKAWQRKLSSLTDTEQLHYNELRSTRRQFLIMGLGILVACLTLARLIGIPESGPRWVMAESLIIGGWVAVWVPIERYLYSGRPHRKELAMLRILRQCDLQFLPHTAKPN
jgi:hypothetical protein